MIRLKKLMKISVAAALIAAAFAFFAYAQSFSEYWYQDSAGWHVKDGSGTLQKNCWLCDDAVPENGKNIWYLIDKNGNMMAAGLVQDGTGNFYSLEMNHNGYFGMLRYQSGTYTADGLTANLSLEGSHNGSFAAIRNADGIEALKAKYGVTVLNIDNSNIVYTSAFSGTKTAAAASALCDADFTASGSSVQNADVIGQLKRDYNRDAAVYFYYDPSADASKEGVVKTSRGITLGASGDSVRAAYGNPSGTGSCSSPSSTIILEIAYRNDPGNVQKNCSTYDVFYTPDGSKALMFTYDSAGAVSYIFYYLA